jgi:hypothetical protein
MPLPTITSFIFFMGLDLSWIRIKRAARGARGESRHEL